MEEEFLWFYRVDKNPTIFNEKETEWTLYEKNSENIESAYQDYLYALEEKSDIINTYLYKIEDSNLEIDFVYNVEKDGENERLVGRFSGNVNENKDLKNTLTSNIYKWYYNTSENNIFPIWGAFSINVNKRIELQFINFSLSKASSIYEEENKKFDFNKFTMTTKKDMITQELARSNQSPKDIPDVNYTCKNETQTSTVTTITEETLHNIHKEHYLTFKNIFSSNVSEKKII